MIFQKYRIDIRINSICLFMYICKYWHQACSKEGTFWPTGTSWCPDKNTKARLTVLSQGDNVIIPIPSIDRGPTDKRNIKGVVMNVNEHGGYKIGTKVGQIKGYLSRNQVQFFANATLKVCEVPMSEMSVREIVRKISLSGRQGFVHCQCKKGSCKSGRCKCRRMKVLCNSRCHMSLSCSNK